MIRVYLTLAAQFALVLANAQLPQIARVNTAGVTVLYESLKPALSEAQDDDFIYLPGGSFTYDSFSIKKRVHIIGAGHYPDSTYVTGRTVINANCHIFSGANNGDIQGVEINGSLTTSEECNFTFSKSRISNIQIPGLPSTIGGVYTFSECIFNSWVSGFGFGNDVKINASKCIFLAELGSCNNSIFRNCIFLYTVTNGYLGNNMNNNQFINNIFLTNGLVPFQLSSGNQFLNNHVTNSNGFSGFGGSSVESNTTSDLLQTDTFQNLPVNTFDYIYNFRLTNTSTAKQSGNDGTDKGIYGTTIPYNPNPFNPHIYFKNTGATSNAQGQLQIEFRVKAQ